MTHLTLKISALVLTFVSLVASVSVTQAGNVNISQVGATTTWNLEFDPITFTVNADGGTMDWLVFEDFFSANSTANGSTVAGSMLNISVNGAPGVNYVINNSTGTFASTNGGIDPNDLFINIAQISTLSANGGDTLVVSGSGIQFTSTSVPLPVAGPINVAFWENFSASQKDVQTNAVSVGIGPVGLQSGVPEPSTLILAAAGLLSFAGTRRRRRR